MIEYERGYWGTGFIWTLSGSVLPKSFYWAFPNAIFAGILHIGIYRMGWFPSFVLDNHQNLTIGMSGYTMVLGFLLVFRTREAYSRWWESITLLQTTRGEWFGAYSNLIAFCTRDPARKRAVETFQHTLVRLMSLLYGSALDQVSTVAKATFEILDLSGFDEEHLDFLAEQEDKLDIVLQWLQQLVVTASKQKILDIEPPILSRVFQELSRGKVNITNARKLSEFPFPFPYAQLLVFGLLIQWLVTPVLMCLLSEDFWWAAITSFFSSWFMWSINYVGEEIEEPYGDDSNDLPLESIQRSFNSQLVILLMHRAQSTPSFNFDATCRVLRVSAFGSASGNFIMPGTSSADTNMDRVLSHITQAQEYEPRTSYKSQSSFSSVLTKSLTQGMSKREKKKYKAKGFTGSDHMQVCHLVNADLASNINPSEDSPRSSEAPDRWCGGESVDAQQLGNGGTPRGCELLGQTGSGSSALLDHQNGCKDDDTKSTLATCCYTGSTGVVPEILPASFRDCQDSDTLGREFEDCHPEASYQLQLQPVPKHEMPRLKDEKLSSNEARTSGHGLVLSKSCAEGVKR